MNGNGKRASARRVREEKEMVYRDLIRLNIKLRPGSHSDYVERLIRKEPQDRGIILTAERVVFNQMKGN